MPDAGSPVFCIIPWIHLHVWPDGTTYPCCFYSSDEPVGTMQKSSLEELWNSDGIKRLRLDMLAEKPTAACSRCYEIERAGTASLRQNVNRTFAAHWDKLASTQPDGSVADINLAFFDVRFSNLCTFRCRTCGPGLSSGWYEDAGEADKPKLLHPTRNQSDLWKQIEPLIPAIEQINFAGGEPLIIDEHYQILKRFLAMGRTKVRIRYNTNFAQMVYRGEDVRTLWNQFEDVAVGASLDAMGPRAEYLRKGTVWAEIEENRRRMKEMCPHVRFYVSCTLSLMNALHAPDFHRAWVEAGLIGVNEFQINLLTTPLHHRVQVLPPELKEQLRERYRRHIDGFSEQFGPSFAPTANAFESVMRFMDEADLQSELPTFRRVTGELDRLRHERFDAAFPELASLQV